MGFSGACKPNCDLRPFAGMPEVGVSGLFHGNALNGPCSRPRCDLTRASIFSAMPTSRSDHAIGAAVEGRLDGRSLCLVGRDSLGGLIDCVGPVAVMIVVRLRATQAPASISMQPTELRRTDVNVRYLAEAGVGSWRILAVSRAFRPTRPNQRPSLVPAFARDESRCVQRTNAIIVLRAPVVPYRER